jgi:hypothetical protein
MIGPWKSMDFFQMKSSYEKQLFYFLKCEVYYIKEEITWTGK